MNYEMIQVGYDVEKQRPIFEKREARVRTLAPKVHTSLHAKRPSFTSYLTAIED